MKARSRRGETSLSFIITTVVFLTIAAGMLVIVREAMNRFVGIQKTTTGSPWL